MSCDTPWVDGRSIGAVLRTTSQAQADRDALVFPQLGLRWSFAEFHRRVRVVSRALVGWNLGAGDHLGVWATNWPEWLLLQFAAAEIGAVLVNVNPAYRDHELGYVIEQADLAALFLTDSFKTSQYELIAERVIPELSQPSTDPLVSKRFPKLRLVISIKDNVQVAGIHSWSAFLSRADRVHSDTIDQMVDAVGANDPANIQYTSGTTGMPKGAMLSHRNLLLNAYHVGSRQRITPADRVCIPVPFYHCFGCVMGTLMCVVHGATMVIPAESFDPDASLKAIAQERCTAIYGVPTMFHAMLHSPLMAEHRGDSLRTGIMAGSPCPIELMKRVIGVLGAREITIAYGLTEAAPVITQTETTEPIDIRVSTVGRPLPGVEVKLIDAEGATVEGDRIGELCTRGHGVMIGYYNMPEATGRAINADGWLRTGDLAQRLETGHYKITGRSKDMIIRGGENIYPREIEEFLLTHPDIRDVQVVGLPDEKFGEEVCAWIIARDNSAIDPDGIRAFCRERIAHFKVPRYIEFVEDWPLTVTGKVQKFRLREMGIDRYHLSSAARIETA